MNGTGADADFLRYPWLGTDGDAPISTVLSKLRSAQVATMADWCSVCSNDVDRGCGALTLAAKKAKSSGIGALGAGFVGAAAALVVAALALAVLVYFGFVTFGRSRKERRRSQGSTFNKKAAGEDDAYPLGDVDSIRKVPV
jgi:tryptophan synthase beta subunit